MSVGAVPHTWMSRLLASGCEPSQSLSPRTKKPKCRCSDPSILAHATSFSPPGWPSHSDPILPRSWRTRGVSEGQQHQHRTDAPAFRHDRVGALNSSDGPNADGLLQIARSDRPLFLVVGLNCPIWARLPLPSNTAMYCSQSSPDQVAVACGSVTPTSPPDVYCVPDQKAYRRCQ